MVLYQVCKPFNWKRAVVWTVMTAAMAGCILGFGDFFLLSPLSQEAALLLALFMPLAYSVLHGILWTVGRYRQIRGGAAAGWRRRAGILRRSLRRSRDTNPFSQRPRRSEKRRGRCGGEHRKFQAAYTESGRGRQ